MLETRMHIVDGEGEGPVEWRVAPDSEPLASCAFRWPAGWTAATPPWQPPGLGVRSPLCQLEGPEADDRLTIDVLRHGVEVDGLAALAATTPVELVDVRWTGLPLVEAREAKSGARWAVVHAGPALFALRATGRAIADLPAAARTLRSLSGRPPAAEPLAPLRVGALRTAMLARWTVEPSEPAPHGYARRALSLDDPEGRHRARLDMLVVDRRVHVGLDPHVLLSAADARLKAVGITPGARRPDPGASGPGEVGVVAVDDARCEHRRALRAIGPALVVVDGLWRLDAPVARLNGRRHLDILLALAARGASS